MGILSKEKIEKILACALVASITIPNVAYATPKTSSTINSLDESDLNQSSQDDLVIDNDNVNLIDDTTTNTPNGEGDKKDEGTPPKDEVTPPNDEELEKVTSTLENKWDKSYTASLSSSATVKVVATTDGGYFVVVCDGGKISFNKFTKSGSLDWKQEHEVNLKSIIDADYVSDGSILITGLTEIENTEGEVKTHSTLMKVDLNGRIIWSNDFVNNDELFFENTEVLSDGSFISVGYSLTEEGKSYPTIYRINPDGEEVWKDCVDSSEGKYVDLVVKDNNIVVGFNGNGDLFGSTPLGGKDIILVNYNPNGDKGEFKLLGGKDNEILKSMDLTKDGNILLMGTFESADVFGGFATKVGQKEMVLELNNSYEPVWGYSVGYNLEKMLVSIDGSLLLSGNGVSSILNKKSAYLECVKKDQEPVVLDFRFSGAKNDFAYSTLTQLADNNVIAGSLITESKSSYVNVRSLSLGLESEDFRPVALTATLNNGSIIDAVSSMDNKYITLRLNDSGKYTDLKSFEGINAKSLTSDEDGGFTFIYASKDLKTIKAKYSQEGSLVSETLITDGTSNSGTTNGGTASNGTTSTGNSSSTTTKPDSTKPDSTKPDSTKPDGTTTDSTTSNGTPNDSNPSDSTQSSPAQGDSTQGSTTQGTPTQGTPNGGTTQETTTSQPNVGLTEVPSYKGTLPYTGLDDQALLPILGVVALVGGSIYFYMDKKYHSKKYI